MKPEKIIVPIILLAGLGFGGYWLWKKYGSELFSKSEKKTDMKDKPSTASKEDEPKPVAPSTGEKKEIPPPTVAKKEVAPPKIDQPPTKPPTYTITPDKPTSGIVSGPTMSLMPVAQTKPPATVAATSYVSGRTGAITPRTTGRM